MDDPPPQYEIPPESELLIPQDLLNLWNALPPDTQLQAPMTKADLDVLFNAVLATMRMSGAGTTANRLALSGDPKAFEVAWNDYVREYFESHKAYAALVRTIISNQMIALAE